MSTADTCQHVTTHCSPPATPLTHADIAVAVTRDTLVDHAYDALAREGHDVRTFKFAPGARRRGHKPPLNAFDWMAGCVRAPRSKRRLSQQAAGMGRAQRLMWSGVRSHVVQLGIQPSCAAGCEHKLSACVARKEKAGKPADVGFAICIDSASLRDAGCDGCAPSLEMLKLSETPILTRLSRDAFGAPPATKKRKPGADSRCTVDPPPKGELKGGRLKVQLRRAEGRPPERSP